MRTTALLLCALPLAACASKPVGGLDVQPELVPKFDLDWDPALDEGSGRLVVDFSTERWAETLLVGDQEVPPGSELQIVVTTPFGIGKAVFLHDPATGSSVAIPFQPYTTAPNPYYEDFAVVPAYSEADGGTLLHILVGSKAEEGVKVLVKQAP